MDRSLVPWPVAGTGFTRMPQLLAALAAALDGTGPALAPTAGPGEPLPGQVRADVALAVRTSGSTGTPRRVLLGGDALRASAERTHARLGGPGRWLLALPLDHVAGLQVLVRSVVARTAPVVTGSSPEAIASALRGMGPNDDPVGGRRRAARLYTALVPTQLHRIVRQSAGGVLPERLAPLRLLDAILVGGASTPDALRAAALDLGLPVVTTYGMTETCGGCVYDGVPLDGVRIELDDGVVRIAGPTLAAGYLVDGKVRSTSFEDDDDGTRWFRTADLGRIDADGRLTVLGRLDDVLVTGGVKVAPAAVERVLATAAGVSQVCVVGVPDSEWGTSVTAVVVPGPQDQPDLAQLREAVTRTLGSAAAPRELVLVRSLPLLGPGKVDRAAVARLAIDATRPPDVDWPEPV